MDNNLSNWIRVSESRFPWEREALEFIRQQFPSHSPYLAWSNFEFIANDGSINEVDLLVFTPQGFFLIEIEIAFRGTKSLSQKRKVTFNRSFGFLFCS